MNIDIICIGKLKEKYWQEAAEEYAKRLSRFCKLNRIELAESRLPDNAKAFQEQAVIEAESRAIMSRLPSGQDCCRVALDPAGKAMSSESFAAELASLALDGKSRVAFVTGGSLGLSRELKKAVDLCISFSPMTFPHQLFRVMLLEQLYRAFKINSNEKYHK